MSKVLIPIADGTEEMEAVIMIDVLRRAGTHVVVASVMSDRQIKASRDVMITADRSIDVCHSDDWDMIALPGGIPGADHLYENKDLKILLQKQFEQGKWVAAICASPAVVLGRHRLIENYTVTCYPQFMRVLEPHAGSVSYERVALDRNLITSQGPGTAMEFALKLVEVLHGQVKANEIAEAMVFNQP